MLLDILIPTYKRPHRVLETIKTLLSAGDKRFRIICSSNCYENDLEILRKIDARVSYNYFEDNIGPVGNIKELLLASTSKYAMYLSDEDTLDLASFILFLDHLETLDENQSVILCSVFNASTERFFYKIPLFLEGHSLDLGTALTLHIFPHYLSGYVFKRQLIEDKDIENHYSNSRGGVYPMLYLGLELLKKGELGFFSKKMVLLGSAQVIKDDNFYGDINPLKEDSHSEKSNSINYYNPYIYSASAFVRQFYFAEKQLVNLKPFISQVDYFYASINRFLHMYISIALADKVFRNTKHSISRDCEIAFQEALKDREVSGSIYSKLFRKTFKFPVSIGYYLAKMISISIKISKYMLVVWRLLSKKY